MTLIDWAMKWGVPVQAVHDLENQIGIRPKLAATPGEGSEGAVMADVRLEAAQAGGVLFRNNVGAAKDARGNFFRFGLCNDTKAIGAAFKSSDLIGIRPLVVTPYHIGWKVGQFVARETKRPGWKYTGTVRERAQLRFLELIISMGGDAAFAAGRGTL